MSIQLSLLPGRLGRQIHHHVMFHITLATSMIPYWRRQMKRCPRGWPRFGHQGSSTDTFQLSLSHQIYAVIGIEVVLGIRCVNHAAISLSKYEQRMRQCSLCGDQRLKTPLLEVILQKVYTSLLPLLLLKDV